LNRRAPGTLSAIEGSLESELQASVPSSDVEQGSRVGLAYPAIQPVTAGQQ
jgi:hypothetical protein